jgi:glyoxylase-like metal-dependent hydrolase (beta-lactamase superfamily II)
LPTREDRTVDATTYDFRVGMFACTAISDGTFTYAPPMFPPPPQLLFADAPQERVAVALSAHAVRVEEWREWISDYICLLVDTGDGRVLIDTGAGSLGPDTGNLLQGLTSAGVDPAEIDLVVLTHGHPDHLGGNTDTGGSVVFPNARWVMAKAEWEFWMEGQAEAVLPDHSKEVLLGFARRNLAPLGQRLSLVDGEEEVWLGIRVVPAPGHTPGHIAVRVSSAGEQLLCIADLALHPLHLEEPGWIAGVDMLPEQLVAQRRALFGMAASEKCRVMAFHLPFPGLGHISAKGAAWQWEAGGENP